MNSTEKIIGDMKRFNVINIAVPPKKPFIFTSGMRARVFFDSRVIALEPNLRKEILKQTNKTIKGVIKKLNREKKKIDLVVSVPHGADYYAGHIAENIKLSFLQLEKDKNANGKKKKFKFPAGSLNKIKKRKSALIIDDVLTTGGSAWGVIDFLKRNAGIKTTAIFALLDRQQGSSELFQKHDIGLNYYSLFNMEKILKYLLKSSLLKPKEIQIVNKELKELQTYKKSH